MQYQIAIIMVRSQHFPVPVLSSFLFPSRSLLRSGPLIYSYLGSDVSSAGAEPRPTTHYVLCKLLIEAGYLIQAASSIEARNSGGGLLLEVLRYNVN